MFLMKNRPFRAAGLTQTCRSTLAGTILARVMVITIMTVAGVGLTTVINSSAFTKCTSTWPKSKVFYCFTILKQSKGENVLL
jgi:hypothetical protein